MAVDEVLREGGRRLVSLDTLDPVTCAYIRVVFAVMYR